MTEDMIKWERSCGFFGDELLKKLHNVEYILDNGLVTLHCRKLADDNIDKNINFNDGATAQYVSNTIMTENDRQIARAQSQRLKD